MQLAAEVGYPYDINTQEVEQKSSVELSVKRTQKQNKDLVKQNTHLVKSVDNLKKEKELLVSERVKLKAEIKSLEKDLKKASSKDHRLTKKTSQLLIDDTSVDIDGLREKIQVLEDQLTERDHIAALLKQRLDRSHMETSNRNESEEHEKSSSSSSLAVLTKNGTILDQAAALEMLLDEYETSLRLRRENEDYKSRLSVLETEIGTSKLQRDNPSPKSPRKRSSGFFKRGKKSSSSITSLRHTLEDTQQIKGDYGSTQTPDVLVKSDSHHEQLDVSVSPFLTHSKDSTISILNYNSPNLSPQMPTKNRDHVEILTLQSCLKLAIEEKTTCKECIAILEKELDGTRSKITELEDSVSASVEKAAAEIERLKSSLNAARIERDTFCGELKIVQTEVDELVDKNEKMDKMFTESLRKKNKLIRDLEQEVEMMKKTKSSSQPSSNKPPAYGVVATPAKLPSVVSPTTETPSTPLQPKGAGLGKASKDSAPLMNVAAKTNQQHKQAGCSKRPHERLPSSDSSEKISSNMSSSERPRERLSSSDLSAKLEKISSKMSNSERPRERLSSGDSGSSIKHEKISSKWSQAAKTVSSSPTRKVGRLSRESSIDRFETPPKEVVKTRTSNSNIPTISAHSPKVAATRAMFEQRIGEVKTDQIKVRWTTKTNAPTDNQRRSSISGPNTEQVKPMHSKSYSYDNSSKQSPCEKVFEQSTGSGNKPTVTPPATVKEQVNEPTMVLNEAKDKINSTQQHHQQQPPQPVSNAAAAAGAVRKSKTPPKSVAKVSRIIITSVASPTQSPVLGSRKNIGVSSPKGEQQLSSSSAMLMRHPTSPSLGPGSIPFRKTPSPGQIGQTNSTSISTVSTTVRHSAPSKAATVSEISPPVHKLHPSTVQKVQTQGQLHLSSNGDAVQHTTTSHLPTGPTTGTGSLAPSSNRVVVKMSSRIGTTVVSTLGSLQNISTSCQVNGNSEARTPPQNGENNSVKVSTASTTSGIRRGPTHKAMQRRERKERPKTMYAGRAETANLVNLISRFQEAEKEKSKESIPAYPPKVNGTSAPSMAPTSPVKPTTTTTVTTTSNHTSFVAPLRHTSGGRDKQTRPTSYCNPAPNKMLVPAYSIAPLPHTQLPFMKDEESAWVKHL